MKRLVFFVLASVLCAAPLTLSAQQKEVLKERKEVNKASKSELNAKATKAARKEAKRLKKAGWEPVVGGLPIEKQLDRSYMMEYELDDKGYPKYIIGTAESVGQNYAAAQRAATEVAKIDLAGKIQTEMTALVEATVSNQELAPEEAASIAEVITASKNLISQSIGRVVTVVELRQVLPNKNQRVMVRLAYNSDMAKEAAAKVVKKELENKGVNLHGKLDKMLGL